MLRKGSWLAAFDGDYVTTKVAIGPYDPLQSAVEATIANFVHDRWLTRRLSEQLATEGFTVSSIRGYGYTQTSDAAYMLTLVDPDDWPVDNAIDPFQTFAPPECSCSNASHTPRGASPEVGTLSVSETFVRLQVPCLRGSQQGVVVGPIRSLC